MSRAGGSIRWRFGAGGPFERLSARLDAGDANGVGRLLHARAVLIIDSGGPSPIAPVEGRVAVAGGLVGLMTPATTVEPASINAAPGLVLRHDEQVVAAVTARVRWGLLTRVWAVNNPDKLRHWNR